MLSFGSVVRVALSVLFAAAIAEGGGRSSDIQCPEIHPELVRCAQPIELARKLCGPNCKCPTGSKCCPLVCGGTHCYRPPPPEGVCPYVPPKIKSCKQDVQGCSDVNPCPGKNTYCCPVVEYPGGSPCLSTACFNKYGNQVSEFHCPNFWNWKHFPCIISAVQECSEDRPCCGNQHCCPTPCGGTKCFDCDGSPTPPQDGQCPEIQPANCIENDEIRCNATRPCPCGSKCCLTRCRGTACYHVGAPPCGKGCSDSGSSEEIEVIQVPPFSESCPATPQLPRCPTIDPKGTPVDAILAAAISKKLAAAEEDPTVELEPIEPVEPKPAPPVNPTPTDPSPKPAPATVTRAKRATSPGEESAAEAQSIRPLPISYRCCPGKDLDRCCPGKNDCPPGQTCCPTNCGGSICRKIRPVCPWFNPNIKCVHANPKQCGLNGTKPFCKPGQVCCPYECGGTRCIWQVEYSKALEEQVGAEEQRK